MATLLGKRATKVKPDGPSAELKVSILAVPQSPSAVAGPQHCDFEAGLPGGRHEGRCRGLFLDPRLRPAPIHPR